MMDPQIEKNPPQSKTCHYCAISELVCDLRRPSCHRCANLKLECSYELTTEGPNVDSRAGLPLSTESVRAVDVYFGTEQDDLQPACNEHSDYEIPSVELGHIVRGNDVTQVEPGMGWVGLKGRNKNAAHLRSKACSASSSSAAGLATIDPLQDQCKASQLTVRPFIPVREQDPGREQRELQPGEGTTSTDHARFPRLEDVFGKCAARYNTDHVSDVLEIEGNESLLLYAPCDARLSHLLSRPPGDTLSESTSTSTTSNFPSIFSVGAELQSNSDHASSHTWNQGSEIWDDVPLAPSTISTPQVGRSPRCLINGRKRHAKTSKLAAGETPTEGTWNCSHADCQFGVHFRLLKIGSDLDEHDPYLVDISGSDVPQFIAFSCVWSNNESSARTTWQNFERYRQSIPIPTLPELIRKSITLTRILGCQYLWVDSLCIVQDDLQDREAQVEHMEQIFSNAFAVLIASGKCSSQSAWFRRYCTLRQTVFSSRIIEISTNITVDSTPNNSPRFPVNSFLDNHDDPWTSLKPTLLSELKQLRIPEMKTSFYEISNASAQRWDQTLPGDCLNPTTSSTDNDMFKFSFASGGLLSGLQLHQFLREDLACPDTSRNDLSIQLTFAELSAIESLGEISGKLQDNSNTAKFKATKTSRSGGSWKPSALAFEADRRKIVENFRGNGSCIRCFVMRKTCDTNNPCHTCIASKGKSESWMLPCRRCWLGRSKVVSVPSWSWELHRIEIMNSKANNTMSIDTLRRHMEIVYGIVASRYQWEKQISTWRMRNPLTLSSVAQILSQIKVIRALLEHRIWEATRTTTAAPKHLIPMECSSAEIRRKAMPHRSTSILSLALLEPAGYLLHANNVTLKKLLTSKSQAEPLALQLPSNMTSDSLPTDTNNGSGTETKAGNCPKLARGTHRGQSRCPSGSRRGLGKDKAGRGNLGRQRVGKRPPWGQLVPGPQRRRLYRCPCDAAGLTENLTSQCYKTADKVQRIKDYHLKMHHHWSNNMRWLPRVRSDTDEDRWNRLFLKANPHWAEEHTGEPLPSPYHPTSDVKDYVLRHPRDYPEPLWPDEQPTADVLTLTAGPESNINPAITGLLAQTIMIEHVGRDYNDLFPTVTPNTSSEIRYQEAEPHQSISPREIHASTSNKNASMANESVPHDGVGFVEDDELETDEPTDLGPLSTDFDPTYNPQTHPSTLSTPKHSIDGEDRDENLLDQYTTEFSDTSAYPESPLFSLPKQGGTTTEPTSWSIDFTLGAGKSQNDKLCFCEDTSDSLNLHFFCREQCRCEPCRGWKLSSDRGKDILDRAIKGELSLEIPK